jgi:hypothetical protein
MGKIMEAVFCAIYLIATTVFGATMLKTAKDDKQRLRFGLLTLVLVGGDAFHLVPRIYGAVTGTTDELYAVLGFGTLVTSITMTVFYVLFLEFWLKHTGGQRGIVTFAAYAVAGCRIALCLFSQNDWLSANTPLSWGIYRNIPFVVLGGIVVWRLFKDHDTDRHFKWAWLAVTLSFLFYLPVVLFADKMPIIGMLMLPKTVCYVWLVVMGYRATKRT